MTAVGQVDDFRDGRWYEHPVTASRLESATNVIRSTNAKPWLADWGGSTASDWTVHHLPLVNSTVEQAGTDAAGDLIKGAAKRKRQRARELGSDVHHVIEALLLGAPLPTFEGLDDEQKAEIDNVAIGFLNFLQDWDIADADIEMSEATVADPVLGVAGTLDLLIRLRGFGLTLIDAKSGAHLDATMAAQIAAYRAMTEVWLPTGLIRPMPTVESCAILHLRPEFDRGYKLITLANELLDDAHEWFCRMLSQHQRAQEFKRLPARVVYPPLPDGSQPPPMLDDVDGYGKVCGVLRGHGFKRLDEMCTKTGRELLALKGFGPKSLESLLELLALNGLALADAVSAVA